MVIGDRFLIAQMESAMCVNLLLVPTISASSLGNFTSPFGRLARRPKYNALYEN